MARYYPPLNQHVIHLQGSHRFNAFLLLRACGVSGVHISFWLNQLEGRVQEALSWPHAPISLYFIGASEASSIARTLWWPMPPRTHRLRLWKSGFSKSQRGFHPQIPTSVLQQSTTSIRSSWLLTYSWRATWQWCCSWGIFLEKATRLFLGSGVQYKMNLKMIVHSPWVAILKENTHKNLRSKTNKQP